ncbi:MAG: membrane dipeptidase [Deferribacteres bacterium]|nr:membrane dipeptidase [Deferribacteres bacterium]
MIGLATVVILGLFAIGCGSEEAAQQSASSETDLQAKADALAQQNIIVDTHVDIPYRMTEYFEDISGRTELGDFDYVRAREGGLDVPFMSIYVASEFQETGGAKAEAERLIDMVEKFTTDWPDQFAMATSVSDVESLFGSGKIALAMGMENGAPVEDNLENLAHFHQRGIRYITLTHGKANQICDSSYDPERKWNGLSPFGRDVVAEMNRLGIMVDISHVSDSTFYQVLRLTKAPVIASHSALRQFTPGWERNMSDDMLKALAENGGVIMIAFGSSFLSETFQKQNDTIQEGVADYLKENNLKDGSPEAVIYSQKQRKANPIGTVDDVVKHIDRVVQLVGIDHVGFGSDFDGVFGLPAGLQDVSGFPNLIEALLKKGYSEEDIAKICSGNVLRVWRQVEEIAAASN